MTAPALIETLQPGEVFVFGSNAEGRHDGGAARFAVERFGAVYGQGEGLQGQSYALPTMGRPTDFMAAAARFIQFAHLAPQMRFLLTEVGCGIAGYTVEWVAPLFKNAPANVELPASFEKALNR